MKQAFNELVLLIRDEHTVSAYELCTSGLVQALYSSLSVSRFQQKIHYLHCLSGCVQSQSRERFV